MKDARDRWPGREERASSGRAPKPASCRARVRLFSHVRSTQASVHARLGHRADRCDAGDHPAAAERGGTLFRVADSRPLWTECTHPDELHGNGSGTEEVGVLTDGCLLSASVVFGYNVNVSPPPVGYNFTFSVGGAAEITPSGQMVRYTNLTRPTTVTSLLAPTLPNTTLFATEFQPVFDEACSWSPATFAAGEPAAHVGSPVGNATFQVSFTWWDTSFNTSAGASAARAAVQALNQTNSTDNPGPITSGVWLGFGISGLPAGRRGASRASPIGWQRPGSEGRPHGGPRGRLPDLRPAGVRARIRPGLQGRA
jgi:hypothetical protein